MKDWSQFRDFNVYLVTDTDLCLGRPVLDVVNEAVAGGISVVQIREKNAKTRDFLELAKLLVDQVQSKGIPILINDRIDIALASNAAGVHIGQSDMPVSDARLLLGDKKIIGLTTPSLEIFKASVELPVQYLAAGPVYATNTKKDTAPEWGLEGMKTLRAHLDSIQSKMPLMTIGGINAQNAKGIYDAGVDSIAIVSAICSAKNVEESTRQICAAFK